MNRETAATFLLSEWLKRVQWDYTGAFGETQSVVCPACRQKGKPGVPSWKTHEPAFKGAYVSQKETIAHTAACHIGRTLAFLRTSPERDRMEAAESIAAYAGEMGLTAAALAKMIAVITGVALDVSADDWAGQLTDEQLMAVAARLTELS